MNTRSMTAEYRLRHWTEIIREQKESGMSVKAYCEKAGKHENVYFYWQKKLREAASAQMNGALALTGESVVSPRGFAEVKVSEPSASASVAKKAEGNEIYIEITGIRISAGSQYPVEQLTQLVRELVCK